MAAAQGRGEHARKGRGARADQDHLHPARNTRGGVQPAAGCASSPDAGNKNFVPYTADYFFYRLAEAED